MNRGRINSLRDHGGDRARRILRGLRGSEDGQALVELALVVPLLLLLVLGIVDFGRAVNYWNDENHLASVGARYAAVGALPTGGTCGPASANATNPLVAYLQCEAGNDSLELKNGSGASSPPNGIQGTGLSGSGAISVCVPSNAVGQPVTVAMNTTFQWLPLPKMLGGGSPFANPTLKGTATMRLENTVPAAWITTTAC
jgi:TadE-like protein